MDNWDDLRFLVALARTGTMKAAAQVLGTNTATVSRRIERLSETLGQPAFIKTTDGWKPSKAVEGLIHVAQSFDGQIQSALNAQSDADSAPVVIKMGSVPFVLRSVLAPGLQRDGAMLDGINMVFSDRVNKEGLGDHDLVIQYRRPEQGRVVTRKAGELSFRLFRPKGSISGAWAGLAESMDDDSLIQMAYAEFKCPPRLRVDNFHALQTLMKTLNLAAPLPDLVGMADPELEPVTPEAAPEIKDFWLFFHESRRSDPSIRRAVDFVLKAFEEAQFSDSAGTKAG
ncbi:LysR family transcriptional regulator [Tropicibacter naphthalenivorans]|uniref:Bacterial regulatory helix-turn-helix protein, lysR family n=1 Tax=Tropicibacter naphthalenivorans TaxID=441103 RepID=A0A0P1G7I6_9RHOB|nr:LysR family transcriptional regulator [Tropicibacter naphthalenivorans]CUH77666.1 Bacterial regulatory helix-turn-helix protein, lysR family [Tropicibacter naphthalenivorans]SMC54475.1 DNA-binding transcriptional regulator, LysR family [Tropicibacter naphthalenivorans]